MNQNNLAHCRWCNGPIPGTENYRKDAQYDCANCYEFRSRITSVPTSLLEAAADCLRRRKENAV